MAKRWFSLIIVGLLALSVFPTEALLFSQNSSRVFAQSQSKKVLSKPLMSLGASLSQSQIAETKRILGNQDISDGQVISVNGKMIAKYLSDVDTSANVYSSAYINPLDKGSGVQVEIVTPSKITKVSSTTYQNAAITSGVSDVQIRIASVKEVTGEGALAGVYALLEEAGVKVSKETVETSQNEISLIDKIKAETKLSDTDANKFLGQLKRLVTQKVSKKEKIDDDRFNDIITKTCQSYKISLSDALRAEIISWLKSFSATDAAKSKTTVSQLDQSLLTSDWADVLNKLDKVLSQKEILALDKQDYSNSKIYHAIINAIYKELLADIKAKKLTDVKLIYSQTFVIEHMLGKVSIKEKEAFNYIRTLCYYYIASSEDSKLSAALTKDKKPVWLVADNTKANFLNALKQYQTLGQSPSLQEVINRIAIATGYSYESFLYTDIKQDEHTISLIIVCPCLDNSRAIKAVFNLKTGECSLTENGKKSSQITYDFKKAYGVRLDNKYQALVDNIKTYKLSKEDKKLVSKSANNADAKEAYQKVLEEYVTKTSDANYEANFVNDYDPILVLRSYNNNKVNYAITDINNDGIDELIIGLAGNTDDYKALVVYTYDGKQAVDLFNNQIPFGLRPDLLIYKDGTLYVRWGSSAWSWSEKHYRIKADNSGLDEVLSYDVEMPGGTNSVSEKTYKVNSQTYNETEFWKKYANFKKYSIFLKSETSSTAEEANIELKEASLGTHKSEDGEVKRKESNSSTSQSKETKKTELKKDFSQLTDADYAAIEDLVTKGYAYTSEIFDKNFDTAGSYLDKIPNLLTEPAIQLSSDSTNYDSTVTLAELTDAYNSYKPGTYDSDEVLDIMLKRYDIEEIDAAYADQSKPVFGETDMGAKYFKEDQTFVMHSGGYDYGVAVLFSRDNWSIHKDYVDVPIAVQSIGPKPDQPTSLIRVKINHKKYQGGAGQQTDFYIDNSLSILGKDDSGNNLTWSTKQAKKLYEVMKKIGKANDVNFIPSRDMLVSSLTDNQMALYTDKSDTEPDIVTMNWPYPEQSYDYMWLCGYEDSNKRQTFITRYAFTIHEGKPVLLLNQQSDAGYRIPGTKTNIPTFTLMSDSDLQKEFTKVFQME